MITCEKKRPPVFSTTKSVHQRKFGPGAVAFGIKFFCQQVTTPVRFHGSNPERKNQLAVDCLENK
jgi:hypothetical protein